MNTLTELNAIERAACRQAVERAKELDDLRAELVDLKAQRDELVEALRHTLARLAAETKDVECCDLYPSTVAAMNEARALLAKLEGGGK